LSSDLSMVRSLRRALDSAGEGRGMARSVVEELRHSPPLGSDAARMLLLGYALRPSLRSLVESASEETAILASLIVAAPESSAPMVGKGGEELAGTLERWVKARENRKLERKVMRFRGVVTSAVLGAVTSMIAALGPLVGSLNFTGGAPSVDPLTLLAGAGAMAAISSAMLGLYMSGRGFLVNVAVTLGVFIIVGAVATPLATLPSAVMWGIK
jgi:hypothetical protein